LKEKKSKLILSGGLFFAVAHFAYYIGMILLFGWVWWSLLIAVPFALFFYLFNRIIMKINYGKMSAGIAFYSLFISIVVCQGLYAFISLPISIYSVVIALGFLLFYASDIVLMRIYFGENQNSKILYYYNLAFYYSAQIMLAVSLFFL
ncbi:MAG: lysoplasmalogenase family protein, partial [Bacteroidales bacterium]